MSRVAFYLDSSSCTGCKACQAACKDKHGLPLGVLWRRVYETAGGGWARAGGAWVSTVFAYNLSIACNHCEQPICVEVCPTGAYSVRPDGVVLLDTAKCMGCQYCTWACPYGAPQYDPGTGRASKCDLCVDEIDSGRPPSCVAACPLRALEFGDKTELEARHGMPPHVIPLPPAELTRPALVITPHPQSGRAGREGALIANGEEVTRSQAGGSSELPLILFTLLEQTAAGAFWALGLLAFGLGIRSGGGTAQVTGLAGPIAALLALLGMAASVAHLGSPANAWRALGNLSRSWLSREIGCALLFTGESILFCLVEWLAPWSIGAKAAIGALTAGAGLALVYSMARAYRLRTIPAWDTPLTTVSFFLTAALLGPLLVAATIAAGPGPFDEITTPLIAAWTFAVAAIQLVIWAKAATFRRANVVGNGGARLRPHSRLHTGRTVLLLGVLLAAAAVIVVPSPRPALFLLAFLALLSEFAGRWLFYERRDTAGL